MESTIQKLEQLEERRKQRRSYWEEERKRIAEEYEHGLAEIGREFEEEMRKIQLEFRAKREELKKQYSGITACKSVEPLSQSTSVQKGNANEIIQTSTVPQTNVFNVPVQRRTNTEDLPSFESWACSHDHPIIVFHPNQIILLAYDKILDEHQVDRFLFCEMCSNELVDSITNALTIEKVLIIFDPGGSVCSHSSIHQFANFEPPQLALLMIVGEAIPC